MIKPIFKAWLLFLGSFIFLIIADYVLRISAGDITTGGISQTIFWLIWLPFILFSMYLLYRSSKRIKNISARLFFIALHIAVPTLIVLVLGLVYTVGTGIDSL